MARESVAELVSFTVLGPVGVRLAGQPVPVPPGRPQTMLAALLLGRGRVSTDRLVNALWDEPPASAASNLRTYAAQLRRLLNGHAGRLTRSGDGYALRVGPDELDLDSWDQAMNRARQAIEIADPDAAAGHLSTALAMWTGVAAAEGVSRRGAVGRGLDTLDEARRSATELYARACIDAGHPDRAVARMRPLVAEHPTRETAWYHLMLALAGAGDRAAALSTYREARQALVTELGIEPGAELRELHARLLRAPGEDAPGRPPTPALGVRTLPPGAELIGRDALLREVVDAFPDCGEGGVVALHGPAGVGKSVLAVRAAWRLAPRFADSQLYLDMCGSSPGVSPMTVAEALNVLMRALEMSAPVGSVTEHLAVLNAALRARRVVIVLDNVLDAAQVRRLLTGLTGAAVILTSRTMLSTLDVGRQVAVGELTPDESVSLLARHGGPQRVAAALDDARELARLCGHLPLALRIVGARLSSRPDWSLTAMVGRLADERHRLDELTVGDLAVRAGLAVTCDTLAERTGGADASALFEAWGAVGAPFLGIDLAVALTGNTRYRAQAALDRLVEFRLIEPTTDDRYRIHDLVRIYAMERAGAPTAAQRDRTVLHRSRCYFLTTARLARDLLRVNTNRADDAFVEDVPTVHLADDKAALHWLETERVNLRDAVLRAAREGTPDGDLFAARLVVELYPFLPMRGYYTDWLALAETGVACARRLGSGFDEASVLVQLAGARTWAGQHEDSVAALRTALAISERLDRPGLVTLVLDHLGIGLAHAGLLDEAKDCLGRCVALHRENGSFTSMRVTLNNLADTHRQLGEFDDALRNLFESLRLGRELGDRLGVGVTTLTIGQVYTQDGRSEQALAWLGDALSAARDSGNREAEWRTLVVRADLHRDARRFGPARLDLDTALALSEHTGDSVGAAEAQRKLAALSEQQSRPAARTASQLWG
jgi:DNA-binding SARP family transcriptional activator/tetratricopeptide (TPR) repeat protein